MRNKTCLRSIRLDPADSMARFKWKTRLTGNGETYNPSYGATSPKRVYS
jgi:hypothetical protein